MAECDHVYIGKVDGVYCTRCGLRLTPQQYRKLLNQSENPQNAPIDADDRKPAKPEKAMQTVTEQPQPKSKRTRKKKENNNE